jgi:hypothetical protein
MIFQGMPRADSAGGDQPVEALAETTAGIDWATFDRRWGDRRAE